MNYSIDQSRQKMAQSSGAKAVFDVGQERDFSLPAQEHYEEIIERPLMVKGRRPISENTGPSSNDVVSNTKMNMVLMGVVMTPQGMTALIKDNQGKYQRVQLDGSVDGWSVVDLQEDKVIVNQGGDSHELMLRKPKPKVAPVSRKPRQNRQNQNKANAKKGGSKT